MTPEEERKLQHLFNLLMLKSGYLDEKVILREISLILGMPQIVKETWVK